MAEVMPIPPLLGDDNGKYRVMLVGNSGVGKSTTGRKVASILGVPFISMDHIHWLPGWQERDPSEFQEILNKKLDEYSDGWVVDGNYHPKEGLRALDPATDVIWLDPPLIYYLPRIVKRTLYRIFGWQEPCAQGCTETFSSVFLSKDSIIWWCLTHHLSIRAWYQGYMTKIGLGVGTDINRRRMRRIGGWGSELQKWIADVQVLAKSKRD
ncbi:AAA domain-containing protein [Panaeolus papilionaceus]|nr:AAA domain-containing protein [Panaeolus papilionaceus]